MNAPESTRRVTIVVPDLFFATRIAAVAAHVGVRLDTIGTDAALDAVRSAPPDLLVVDLAAGDPVLALVRALKSDAATRAIPVVGFYPHVDQALRASAEAAGVDRVLPRSAFTARLDSILRGEGLSPREPDC